MGRYILRASVFLCVLLAGCSSEQSTKDASNTSSSFSNEPSVALAASLSRLDTTSFDQSEEDDLVRNDSLTGAMLERARQHYISASAAQEKGDSVRSASQFSRAACLSPAFRRRSGASVSGASPDSKMVVLDFGGGPA